MRSHLVQVILIALFCTYVSLTVFSKQGLGTNTDEEGKEYFREIVKHKKDFVWEDDEDGDAIELAFSKKKIEARKNWLRQFEVSKCSRNDYRFIV